MNLVEARRAVRRRQRRTGTSGRDAFPLTGGVTFLGDRDTVAPGECLPTSLNYEIAEGGGYERINGFIRYDGINATDADPVPGQGPVRGLHLGENATAFAVRDKVGGGAGLYRTNGVSGWIEITGLTNLALTSITDEGVNEIQHGVQIKGQTSGATATVRGIGVYGNPAKAQVAIDTIVGTFQAGETIVDDLTEATTYGVVASPATSVPTLGANGDFLFVDYETDAKTNETVTYFISRNASFVYAMRNGNFFMAFPIFGPDDAQSWPQEIIRHLDYLVLGFGTISAGFILHSGLGLPTNFTAAKGSASYKIRDGVTGFVSAPATVLFVFTLSETFQFTGTSIDDFQLSLFSASGGALRNTAQPIGGHVHLSNRGFTSLVTSDRFGDFTENIFSQKVTPLLNEKIRNITDITCSMMIRSLNRYRIFWEDGTGLSITFQNDKPLGFMPIALGVNVVKAATRIDISQRESLAIADDDGFVYNLDSPTFATRRLTFNGDPISANLDLVAHDSGLPLHNKEYRRGYIAGDFDSATTLTVTPVLDDNAITGVSTNISVSVGGRSSIFNIDKVARNIRLLIAHASSNEPSHTLKAVFYETSARVMKRSR